MNDLYEAGVDDDIFALNYKSNRENYVAVKTPNGLSRRDTFNDIVMQGDVLAPLISSLQVDTMGKECLEDNKHLYLEHGTHTLLRTRGRPLHHLHLQLQQHLDEQIYQQPDCYEKTAVWYYQVF